MTAALFGLLRLFPRAFRASFGAEIRGQIAQDLQRARRNGFFAWMTCYLRTAIDLVRIGVTERVAPTWIQPTSPLPEHDMAWFITEWRRDLRHGARTLGRTPGFTVMSVLTLGLAIGAVTAIFSAVNAVLLRKLPFQDAGQLVIITGTAPGTDMAPRFDPAAEFYLQYKEQSKLLTSVAGYNSFTSTLRVKDRVERIRMSSPTNTIYKTLGARPILGRLPDSTDESRVAVISYALWKDWFGGDSGVIGQAPFMNGQTRTIVGVMGPDFRFPQDGTMLWISGEIYPADVTTPGEFGMPMVARMAPGATPEAVARELSVLASRLPERFGGSAAYRKIIAQHRAEVTPLKAAMVRGIDRTLWVLMGAMGIVLLIACANVGNLFLVRTEGRQRDLAVRRAIGAGRGQLVRLQMAEVMIVAGLAAVVAIVLARIGIPVLLAAAPRGVPRLAEASMSFGMVLFTLGIAAVAAVLIGVFPAVRGSMADLAWLREGARGSTGRRRWSRDVLVGAQTALALVLLAGSGLLMRSLYRLQHVDPGYETADLFTFQMAAQRETLTDGPSWARFHLDFADRLRQLPGVQSVGIVENIPLNEGTSDARARIEGFAGAADEGTPVNYTFTGADYFKTMGISVLEGRALTNDDQLVSHGNAVLSAEAAKRLWPGGSAVGKRFKLDDDSTWTTVVGVVENVMQYSFRDSAQALVYVPLVGPLPASWRVSTPAYVLKSTRAEVIAPEVRALVKEVAPEAPMYRVYTLAGLARDSMQDLSFTMLTIGIAAALALILSAVGLYGVLSYVVTQRTREIGVRMALGAQAEQVRRMVVLQGARVVGAGVLVGIVVALLSTRALRSLLYGVAPFDLLTFALVAVGMLLVGLLASYLPGRRASNVDPIVSLRSE